MADVPGLNLSNEQNFVSLGQQRRAPVQTKAFTVNYLSTLNITFLAINRTIQKRAVILPEYTNNILDHLSQTVVSTLNGKNKELCKVPD